MIDDFTIAVDALSMAKYTAILNLESALNMTNPQTKQAHLGMSQDDYQIADQLQQLIMQRGWTQPLAAVPQQAWQTAQQFAVKMPTIT